MRIPFICIRDMVVFPNSTHSIYMDRASTLKAVHLSEGEYKNQILILSQKKTEQDQPKLKADLYNVGTICRMTGLVRLQDGSVRARVVGLKKFKVQNLDFKKTLLATGEIVPEKSGLKKSISSEKRAHLIELFVRAKPYIIFDDDLTWLKDLMLVKSEDAISKILQLHLYDTNAAGPKLNPWIKKYGQEARWVNQRNLMQQKILEAKNSTDRLSKIHYYLVDEIKTSLLKA